MLLARFFGKYLFLITLIWFTSCKTDQKSEQKAEVAKTEKAANDTSANENIDTEDTQNQIPEKVFTVLNYVKKYHRAPDGYSGGRRFGNFEKRLPIKDLNANLMKYQEWDVNPKKKGKNRGAERLITSKDERAWYTQDHYETFIEIK